MAKHNNLKKYLVVVLALVAVGLAWLIYKKSDFNVGTGLTPTPSAAPAGQEAYDCSKFKFSAETLLSIANDASEAEKFCHYQYSISIAKASNTLNVSGCEPSPIVLRAAQGANIKLVNNDSAVRKIVFDREHDYSIAAKSSMNIKADFGKGPGLYGYGCDLDSGASGMIFVAPN